MMNGGLDLSNLSRADDLHMATTRSRQAEPVRPSVSQIAPDHVSVDDEDLLYEDLYDDWRDGRYNSDGSLTLLETYEHCLDCCPAVPPPP
jgi:hypothetical protein